MHINDFLQGLEARYGNRYQLARSAAGDTYALTQHDPTGPAPEGGGPPAYGPPKVLGQIATDAGGNLLPMEINRAYAAMGSPRDFPMMGALESQVKDFVATLKECNVTADLDEEEDGASRVTAYNDASEAIDSERYSDKPSRPGDARTPTNVDTIAVVAKKIATRPAAVAASPGRSSESASSVDGELKGPLAEAAWARAGLRAAIASYGGGLRVGLNPSEGFVPWEKLKAATKVFASNGPVREVLLLSHEHPRGLTVSGTVPTHAKPLSGIPLSYETASVPPPPQTFVDRVVTRDGAEVASFAQVKEVVKIIEERAKHFLELEGKGAVAFSHLGDFAERFKQELFTKPEDRQKFDAFDERAGERGGEDDKRHDEDPKKGPERGKKK